MGKNTQLEELTLITDLGPTGQIIEKFKNNYKVDDDGRKFYSVFLGRERE